MWLSPRGHLVKQTWCPLNLKSLCPSPGGPLPRRAPPPALAATIFPSVSRSLTPPGTSCNQTYSVCVWGRASFTDTVAPGLIRVAAHICVPFLSKAECCLAEGLDHIVSVCPSVDGRLLASVFGGCERWCASLLIETLFSSHEVFTQHRQTVL